MRAPWLGRGNHITAGILVTVLVLAGLAQTGIGKRFTTSVGLASGGEAYTELYFANPAHPLGAGRTISLAFVVNSHEHALRTYTWSLTVGTTRGASGSVSLRPGRRVVIVRRIALQCAAPRHSAVRAETPASLVRVQLAAPAESIAAGRCP